MNNERLITFALATLALVPPAANAQNLLVNGSFELPSAFVDTISGPANSTDLPGWTVGLVGIDVVNQQISPPSFAGVQWLDLDGSPGPGRISQAFATTVGQSYKLSFTYGNNVSGSQSPNPGANVSLAGTDLPTFTIHHSTSTMSDFNWTAYETTFTATAPIATLQFSSTSAAGEFGGIALDAVSVVAVPEPTSPTLLGVGMFSWLAARRAPRR